MENKNNTPLLVAYAIASATEHSEKIWNAINDTPLFCGGESHFSEF
jgi:hypothetical protein